MRIVKILFAVTASLLASSFAQAHHSFAEFHADKTITVTGVVTEWQLVNPHAFLFFDAKDDDGKVVHWKVEFDGRTHIGRAGWKDDTLVPGETVTVTGNPAKSGSPYMFFNYLVKSDGTKLVRPFTLSFQNAEAERAKRRAEREQADGKK